MSVELERTGSVPGAGAHTGLSEAEAARRLAARGRPRPQRTSRSYASIVRANVLTVFNAILAGFGAVTLIFGDWRDALFLGVIVANSGDRDHAGGARQARARPTLAARRPTRRRVLRDGAVREIPVEEVVLGDLVLLAPGDQVVADGRLLAAQRSAPGRVDPQRRVRAGRPRRGRGGALRRLRRRGHRGV